MTKKETVSNVLAEMARPAARTLPAPADEIVRDWRFRLLHAYACEKDDRHNDLFRLRLIESAARDVVRWDWSDNDEDCVDDIERLRKAVNAV